MSDLVGNPEDRFSRVAAHLVPVKTQEALALSQPDLTFNLIINKIQRKDIKYFQVNYKIFSGKL